MDIWINLLESFGMFANVCKCLQMFAVDWSEDPRLKAKLNRSFSENQNTVLHTTPSVVEIKFKL